MDMSMKDIMPNTLKRISERMNGLGSKSGNYCNKHSQRVIKTKVTVTEIIDYDEELGVHPVPMIIGTDGKDFCPVCRKKSLEDKLYKERAMPEIRKNQVKNTSYYFKNKSLVTDNTIEQATFENFKEMDDVTVALKNGARKILDEIANGSDKNYLFAGEVGQGKSHLAYAIANQYNIDSYRKGEPKRVVFISIPRMVSKIRHSYSLRDQQLNAYKFKKDYFTELADKCDLVVLDDLGAELGQIQTINPAANDITDILGGIFEARMGKPTIVTTNLLPTQIKELYDVRVESRLMDGVEGSTLAFAGTTDKRKNRIKED